MQLKRNALIKRVFFWLQVNFLTVYSGKSRRNSKDLKAEFISVYNIMGAIVNYQLLRTFSLKAQIHIICVREGPHSPKTLFN